MNSAHVPGDNFNAGHKAIGDNRNAEKAIGNYEKIDETTQDAIARAEVEKWPPDNCGRENEQVINEQTI